MNDHNLPSRPNSDQSPDDQHGDELDNAMQHDPDDVEDDAEDVDDPDREEDCDREEYASSECPSCESSNGCSHKIAIWSGCNADWHGPLVNATKSLHQAIEWTLWRGYHLRGPDREPPGTFGWSLSQLVESTKDGLGEDVDDCDWWGPLREYWMSTASEECGCEVLDDSVDYGACGSCDHFKYVVAEDPARAIADVVAQAESDLVALRQWFQLEHGDQPPGLQPC
jgi:hypothetical protein